eukprot:1079974-Pyramimonas_sp.AAC.1
MYPISPSATLLLATLRDAPAPSSSCLPPASRADGEGDNGEGEVGGEGGEAMMERLVMRERRVISIDTPSPEADLFWPRPRPASPDLGAGPGVSTKDSSPFSLSSSDSPPSAFHPYPR